MKALLISLLICFALQGIEAQVPQAIKYQGVIRTNNGDLLSDSTFSVKITIREASFDGSILYEETHNATTNPFGSFGLNVGLGTVLSGEFFAISWASGDKYLEQSVDFGEGYISTGVMQFLSVPYALHAGNGLPSGALPGQVLSVDSNGNFIWVNPENIGTIGSGSDAKTLIFTSDGF
ncbi:MAG: hypothetical protein SGI87_09810 [Flavobacteriales bacterium]|nr:hypothetical protein [Flavobacteriales bacterium]